MKLQGSVGYYSRELTLDGVTFKVRELSDQELEASKEADAALADKAKTAGTDPVAFKQAREASCNAVIVPGIVSWDLEGYDCTPENRKLLPSHVKIALADAIMADTILTDQEQYLFARSRGRLAAETPSPGLIVTRA
jgi:hypothetical protein